MSEPEIFYIKWEGCNHTDEERGEFFDFESARYCSACSVILKGRWLCIIDNVEPKEYIIDINPKKQVILKACPKCGALYEYINTDS